MMAIITGDIINSEEYHASEWIDVLKSQLSNWGETPTDWEVYRGDEFQLKIEPEKALRAAIRLKAAIRTIKDLDVRMAIGLGSEDFVGTTVSESNGKAYKRSGRMFETLKSDKLNLAIATGNVEEDECLNLMIRLALSFMDEWTSVSAELITIALANPKMTQKEIAELLNIQQSAVSQRQKRARLELVLELLKYYTESIKRMKL